ncbi:hypothetical protein HY374_00400 [Candidatus Berkelbacteria bacterium]|nr:hypothetical protein [Candidatus Berkelbacteria bacterium]
MMAMLYLIGGIVCLLLGAGIVLSRLVDLMGPTYAALAGISIAAGIGLISVGAGPLFHAAVDALAGRMLEDLERGQARARARRASEVQAEDSESYSGTEEVM